MADIVTNGRVVMGVGRGYHTREVESFGAPLLDAAANRELFEEQMEVLLKCFNEESFSHRGKHYVIPPDVDYRGYRLREVTCVPRPIHRPVEIWMPIASGKTIDYMARMGLKAMVTLNGEKVLDQVARAYRDACVRHGRPKQLGEDLCWGVGLYLADSREEAIRHLEPAHDERYKWFAPFGFVRYADEEGRPWGARRARPRADAARGRRAEGVAGRASRRGNRDDSRDRSALPRPRSVHDPLGGGDPARRVQGTASLVRAGRDARLRGAGLRVRGTPPGYTPTG
jgi:alkanesulfonate monooxygenase SsuD/methylene tetrahydromethanopterin reductase-like flavin-dependent oxidoreductase (luciferase family)